MLRSGTQIHVESFSNCVQHYLRNSGYAQKELASVLGLNPKVLSRKLNGSSNAQLTQLEILHIIKALAGWHVITTREEVLHLLEQARLATSSFSAEEWQTPPLSTLLTKSTLPLPSALLPLLFNLACPP